MSRTIILLGLVRCTVEETRGYEWRGSPSVQKSGLTLRVFYVIATNLRRHQSDSGARRLAMDPNVLKDSSKIPETVESMARVGKVSPQEFVTRNYDVGGVNVVWLTADSQRTPKDQIAVNRYIFTNRYRIPQTIFKTQCSTKSPSHTN